MQDIFDGRVPVAKALAVETEELIETLPRQLAKVSRHAVGLRLARGTIFGAIACLAIVLTDLGLRSDLSQAVFDFPFWMKWGYTGSVAAGALYLSGRVARPGGPVAKRAWVIFLPFAGLTAVCLAQLAQAPRDEWGSMWLGGSWKVCSVLLLLLTVPVFAGLVWSFRSFAPTRLRAAGAVVGLAASASAATLYCLHCPEVSAAFVLTWYTLGFILAAAAGALVAPLVLRW